MHTIMYDISPLGRVKPRIPQLADQEFFYELYPQDTINGVVFNITTINQEIFG